MSKKLFCEYNRLFYNLSVFKGIVLRGIKNLGVKQFACNRQLEPLPFVVSSYMSSITENIKGIDIQLQENRKNNMARAGNAINGILVCPGEIFSFWKTVGNCVPAKGYSTALMERNGKLEKGRGGGVCLVASHIHNLVLGSPLDVCELHHHSDALFPDHKSHVPYEIGVSVAFNYIDYRFRNTSDQTIQLLIQPAPTSMFGEMRSEKPFPFRYELFEEDHHFTREGDTYYRNSMIYRKVFDRKTGKELDVEFLHQLHSKVMYDPSLIPPELIRADYASQ